MRPEAVRKALLDTDGKPAIVHLNDGTRIPIKSREHWMIGEEVLLVMVNKDLHHIAFRNIAQIALKGRMRPSSRRKTG